MTAPIAGRVGRAIVTEGNLVSSGPGEATLLTTRRVARSDLRGVRRRRADLPALRRPGARRQARQRARAACRSGWRSPATTDFPREGQLDFLDNQLDPATGTIRGRAIFRNADGDLTPGLFVRLRLPGSGAYTGVLIQDRAVGTDLDKRFVLRRRRRADDRVPRR